MRILLLALLLFASISVNAAAPTCHVNTGGNYCTYKGLVQRIYINDSGLILIYFDAPIAVADAGAVGFSISNGAAAAIVLQTNIEFSKLLYSTALTAKAAGIEVTMQMRGTQNGYLKVDRIWI